MYMNRIQCTDPADFCKNSDSCGCACFSPCCSCCPSPCCPSPCCAATVTVGTTTTGAPGTAASVTNSGTPCNAVLNFTIPGSSGPAETITVGATTTGLPGTAASVTDRTGSPNHVIDFVIPRGQDATITVPVYAQYRLAYNTGNLITFVPGSSGTSTEISITPDGTALNLPAGYLYNVAYTAVGSAATNTNMTVTPIVLGTSSTWSSSTAFSSDTALPLSVNGSFLVPSVGSGPFTLQLQLAATTPASLTLDGQISVYRVGAIQ